MKLCSFFNTLSFTVSEAAKAVVKVMAAASSTTATRVTPFFSPDRTVSLASCQPTCRKATATTLLLSCVGCGAGAASASCCFICRACSFRYSFSAILRRRSAYCSSNAFSSSG